MHIGKFMGLGFAYADTEVQKNKKIA